MKVMGIVSFHSTGKEGEEEEANIHLLLLMYRK